MSWVKPPTGPMRTQLLRITQSVYKARGLPPPVALDHWWHCPQISYLVNNPDDYAPKICIINMGEGKRDHPAILTRFMVNLDNLRVTDKLSDEKFPAPSDIHSLLIEVRQYAIKHHQKEKEARKRAQNRERERLIAEKKQKEKEIEVCVFVAVYLFSRALTYSTRIFTRRLCRTRSCLTRTFRLS